MSLASDTQPPPRAVADDAERPATRADALVDELERRIRELHEHEEHEFGNFTRLDWLILLLGAVIVPILLVIRFAP
jgi:hypothetical protein